MNPESNTGNWMPSANPRALRARARLLQDIREFFSQRDVLEVETPVLSVAGNSDPNLASYRLEHPARWLRTSPEYAMKRLLASGSGDIFELGRVFRAGESGRHHNPEFTMLEWYRLGWDHHRLAQETVALVRHCGRGVFDHWQEHQYTYRKLFQEYAGLDPHRCPIKVLGRQTESLGLDTTDLDRQQLLDFVFGTVIQAALPAQSLVIVHDFPAEQAALARIRPGDPPVAERFELILNGQELANGYHELTDAREQQQRFERENELREARGDRPLPLDTQLLYALRHGLPDCAGVAVGVDRLLMAILGSESINDVLAFPAQQDDP
jgi:lysyl-tRNA synthetase class 2